MNERSRIFAATAVLLLGVTLSMLGYSGVSAQMGEPEPDPGCSKGCREVQLYCPDKGSCKYYSSVGGGPNEQAIDKIWSPHDVGNKSPVPNGTVMIREEKGVDCACVCDPDYPSEAVLGFGQGPGKLVQHMICPQ